MIPAEIIKKKRAGLELSGKEISEFVQGYVDGSIADYQMSALLMAIYFQGMTQSECWYLTKSMLHSGQVLQFKNKNVFRVDKHSTGGVGDKTSLVVAPIVACAGLQVPMISGRGLGHTGGTLDKLESIPGMKVMLSETEFMSLVEKHGLSFIGQTQNICPADKKMYALRDVTGTVECIPLICSSIMSKKLAEGIDGLVMDIKVGSGAFMKTPSEAKKLAREIVRVGKLGGKKVSVLLTDMSQPLGNAIGNALEVEECLEVLKGRGPKDLRELCLELAGEMIWLGGNAATPRKGYAKASEILLSKEPLKKFESIVSAQGGKLGETRSSDSKLEVRSLKNGYVFKTDAEKIGLTSLLLGAGRKKTSDKIDPTAGITIHKKIGDQVKKSEVIATFHYDKNKISQETLNQAEDLLRSSYFIRLQKVHAPRLIIGRIR